MKLSKGDLYQHYKGGVYEIVCLARHSEDSSDYVVYRDAIKPELVWVRPAVMWSEEVECPDGQVRSRFSPVV